MIRVLENLNPFYTVLKQLRKPHGLYLASTSGDYNYVWIRDSVYMAIPYMDKICGTFELTVYGLLDLFKELEDKITYHTQHKPQEWWQYIHARYSAEDLSEIGDHEWGHAQHDSIGAFLWMVGAGHKAGRKVIRDEDDLRIIQKLVDYLITLEYWKAEDNGMWEENLEVHTSSVGAVMAGLHEVKHLVKVPSRFLMLGNVTLELLLPRESRTKEVDLAQLSLVYPYEVVPHYMMEIIVKNVESKLLRYKGCARYYGDSYHSTLEAEHGRGRSRSFYAGTEAEWCFGLSWLALCHNQLGNRDKALEYLARSNEVIVAPGVIPELFYAGTDKYNVNTPLGWSCSMHILATEALSK